MTLDFFPTDNTAGGKVTCTTQGVLSLRLSRNGDEETEVGVSSLPTALWLCVSGLPLSTVAGSQASVRSRNFKSPWQCHNTGMV